jgi:hypothetical protein
MQSGPVEDSLECFGHGQKGFIGTAGPDELHTDRQELIRPVKGQRKGWLPGQAEWGQQCPHLHQPRVGAEWPCRLKRARSDEQIPFVPPIHERGGDFVDLLLCDPKIPLAARASALHCLEEPRVEFGLLQRPP